MTTSSTSLLGLALPVTGELDGTWGDVVNNSLTSLLDTAIAGTTTLSTDADVTLTTTALLANEARQAILLCTGARTAIKTITAPAQSKTYVIINATTGGFGVKIIAIVSGVPTTGVTIPAGKAYMVAWSGSDFVIVKGGIVDLTTDVTGTLPIANGGTGQTTYTDGQLLIGNSTGNTLTKATLTGGTGVTITNGAGAITINGTTYGMATSTVPGLIELASDTQQITTTNAVTAVVGRTYGLQVNSSGQGVVNVPWTDTSYTLPFATDVVLGGVKYASNTVQLTAANTATSTTSRTYAVQSNLSSQMVVNVPWTDTTYSTATTTVNGLIKLGDGTVQTTAANAVSADASRTYAIQLNASGQAVVNVPWTSSSGTATNIAAGAANQILYQSGASTTTFITAPTVASTYLSWNGSAFTWTNITPGSTFATDITVNTLTVGKGPSNPTGTTTFGYQAGAAALSTAIQQTAIGYRALASNTTTAGVGFEWEGNTAVGYKALENVNIVAGLAYNTAVGAGALANATTGGSNVAVGNGAARNATGAAGSTLTAVGTLAAENSTNGGFVAVGYGAFRNSIDASSGSVAVGYLALTGATTYSGNPAIYNQNNTAIGHTALEQLSAETSALAGSSNTALGYRAGRNLLSGSNNTLLGFNAQASTTAISNEITLGNSSVTTLRCQVTSITSLSDQRDKHSIEDLPVGLNLINALRPRRYKWDKRDWYVDEVETIGENGQTTIETVSVPQDGSRAQNDWNEGFVAQEAKAALQSLGADWFPLVYESNPEKLEMSSGKLIPVLVKAIQELTARLEALEAK